MVEKWKREGEKGYLKCGKDGSAFAAWKWAKSSYFARCQGEPGDDDLQLKDDNNDADDDDIQIICTTNILDDDGPQWFSR